MEITFDNMKIDTLFNCNLKFNDFLFNIDDKKITFIVGKSGSGKSRLLSFIENNAIEEGKIIKADVKKIGILRQNPKDFFFCNTIYQEILFALKKKRIRCDYDKKIINSLKMVGLDRSYLNRSPFEISKGEQKKVSLAMVLACNPKLLILDEPFIDLDYASQNKMIKLFRMMKLKYGKTIIIATNNMDVALELADEIIGLKDGKIFFKGDKFDFFTDCQLLEKANLVEPKLIKFTNFVKDTKGINLEYRDDINDLMKDIYRFVR